MKDSGIIPETQPNPFKELGAGIENFRLPSSQPGDSKGGQGVPEGKMAVTQAGQYGPADRQIPGVVFRAGRMEAGVKDQAAIGRE